MADLIIRRATPDDLPTLAALIDGFAATHPAATHVRSLDSMRDAYFGPRALARVLLAERDSIAIGFAAWQRAYDLYWSVFGGEGTALYVRPEHRGSGVALRLITAVCAEIRADGGQYLLASYDPKLESLYERVAVGGTGRSGHVSAAAFQALAAANGTTARAILRALPDKQLNHTAS